MAKPDLFRLTASVEQFYFSYGRGLFGIYESLVYGFTGSDPTRVQLVRFLNFASLSGVGIVLLRFLQRLTKNAWFAFFITLFFFSQQSFQGMVGYSLQLVSNSQPSIWLSLFAFYLFFYFFRTRQVNLFVQIGIIVFLLFLAMQSTQSYAFFALVPLSYLTLSQWEAYKKQIIIFLLAVFFVLLFSFLSYRFGLAYWHSLGNEGYVIGERSFATIEAAPLTFLFKFINPFAYWSAFKLWSYPYPLHNLPPWNGPDQLIATILMGVWLIMVSATFIFELQGVSRSNKREIALKWLCVLLSLGIGAVFIATDSSGKVVEHRSHLTLIFTGVVIFSGAYCLQVMASKWSILSSDFVKGTAVFIIILTAFGAQAVVQNSFVNNHMEQVNFVRTEMMAKEQGSYENILIVLPEQIGCVYEPCTPWLGSVASSNWHLSHPSFYKYALTTIGINPDGESFSFEEQLNQPPPEDTIVIDWNKYTNARIQYAAQLRK